MESCVHQSIETITLTAKEARKLNDAEVRELVEAHIRSIGILGLSPKVQSIEIARKGRTVYAYVVTSLVIYATRVYMIAENQVALLQYDQQIVREP